MKSVSDALETIRNQRDALDRAVIALEALQLVLSGQKKRGRPVGSSTKTAKQQP